MGPDTTHPTVSNFSPADGATNVATTSNIVFSFSEPITRGTGSLVLKTAAGVTIETFDAATSNRLTLSGSTLTIDPTSDLANGTNYALTVAAGTVKDLAGNAYAGTTAYDFTTATSAPTYTLSSSAPTVNEGSPVTFNLATTGVAAGTVLNYVLGGPGITTADTTVPLTGSLTVGATGATSLVVTPTADRSTEGTETLTLAIPGTSATASTLILDTSTATVPTSIYISSGQTEAFTIGNSGVSLFGGASREVITLSAGVSAVTLDQNIDRVNLAGASSSFTFQQAGNQLRVYDSLGTTAIVTLSIQGDTDGTQVGFSNGTFDARLAAGVLAIGGASVNALTPTSLTPVTPTTTVEPNPSSSSSAGVYLRASDTFTVANSGVKVFGNSGTEVLTLASGTSGIGFDQNIEQLQFSGAVSNYRFLQTGNQISVYDSKGTALLAKGAVQGDTDGTLMSFGGSTGSVLLSAGVMRLGGAVVSPSTPAALVSPVLTEEGSAVAVTAAGSVSAADGDFTYTVAMGNYAYAISSFGAGDKIVSPPTGIAGTLFNSSFTDGNATIQYAAAGQTVSVTLTGLSTAQDSALATPADLNTVFGAGTFV